MNVLAIRFIIAFLVLALVFHEKLRACSRESLKGGVVLGVLYTICMTFEMYGLRMIDSGVSSFIENMAIVLVPIYTAILTKEPPKKITMLCALMAIAGVGFLSHSQMTSGINSGIFLTIGAALTYGLCILVTGNFAKKGDPITIGVLQLGTMGVLSFIISTSTGSFYLPSNGVQWGMILMLALVCSCFGFTFQPVGQKYLPAETAAVFTVVNPLTASIAGVMAGETLGISKVVGYAIILTALGIYNIKVSNL